MKLIRLRPRRERRGFFGDEFKGYLYVVKSGNDYQLSINFNHAGQIDTKTVEEIVQFRKDFQEFFPDNKIIINLVVADIENVIKRIE